MEPAKVEAIRDLAKPTRFSILSCVSRSLETPFACPYAYGEFLLYAARAPLDPSKHLAGFPDLSSKASVSHLAWEIVKVLNGS
jgi:hypothetical protein